MKKDISKRITLDPIPSLGEGEIFVFGSNLGGIHGGGAARVACLQHGAKMGVGYGITGRCYAIPTKNKDISVTLSLEEIKSYIEDFIIFAQEYSGNIFKVTKIGCGLAGLTVEEVAPLFKECIDIENIHLPVEFWNVILNN